MSAPTAAVTARDGAFARAAEAASGANLSACLQCRKCTSGCPVSARSDLKPHEIVRLVQLGARDEVLGSRMIWECASCLTCASRCPQGVDIAALIDGLRRTSRSEAKAAAETVVPVFNDIFLRTVRRLGRMYEAGLLASFKFRTLRFFQDMDKVATMLWKRKIAIFPRLVWGIRGRNRLFRKIRDMEGEPR
jgi:heterodisulfide reductase subunit C